MNNVFIENEENKCDIFENIFLFYVINKKINIINNLKNIRRLKKMNKIITVVIFQLKSKKIKFYAKS